MLAVVVMLMNYFHDLASGLMFGSVAAYFLTVTVLHRSAEISDREAVRRRLFLAFRPVVLGALGAVVLGGIPRMIFYYDYEWLPAAGRGQVVALAVKHVFLVSITVASIAAFLKQRPRPQGVPAD
jgi:hypothetical protein